MSGDEWGFLKRFKTVGYHVSIWSSFGYSPYSEIVIRQSPLDRGRSLHRVLTDVRPTPLAWRGRFVLYSKPSTAEAGNKAVAEALAQERVPFKAGHSLIDKKTGRGAVR